MKFDVCGFEHLHLHTDFSLLDGYGTVEEYAKRAARINQQFLCITDHGMMGAIPRQIKACDKATDEGNTLSPIFGCELYINRHQPEAGDLGDMQSHMKNLDEQQKADMRPSAHLLALAYTDVGYTNLVKLSSWGWCKGFYYKPRINHEILQQHKEGLIFTSCCYSSEVGRAFDRDGADAALKVIEEYVEMVGRENYYLEFMLLDFVKQKPYNKFIIDAHEKTGLPLIITNDCHYCKQEDSQYQRLTMMVQTNRTVQEIQEALAQDSMADFFELQDQNLWMKSEEELNAKWLSDYSDVIPYELFCQAKRNTVEICRKAQGVKLDRSIKLPELPDSDEKLREAVKVGFLWRDLPKNREYLNRVKEEYELICRKGFSSYFLIQKIICDEARRVAPEILGWGDGSEAVGPGRGSAVGALTCYCLGITDVDPIYEDLLFSRFLSEARGGKSLIFDFKNIDPYPPGYEDAA
jgi:DNA polymerase-3 subunit alpha